MIDKIHTRVFQILDFINDAGQIYYNITYKVRDLITENFNFGKRI